MRLFQALVAAAAARWNERIQIDSSAPALRWLEQLPSPEIVAANGKTSSKNYRLYVPDNVGDLVAASWSRGGNADIGEYRSEKDVRPTKLDGDGVHYLFRLSGEGCPDFETLREAARSLTHLGWGVDMAVGNATLMTEEEGNRLSGQRWLPTDDERATGLRVPMKGSLDDLMRKHQDSLGRLTTGTRVQPSLNPVPPLSVFRVIGYRRATDPPPRHWVAFRLRHPVEDRAAVFAMTRANCVAAMVRNATARVAKEQGRPNDWIDHYVHGHRDQEHPTGPRFSYVPLATIEHRGGRDLMVGGIRRVLIAELIESGESHLSRLRQMLPGQFLIDDKTQDRKAMLAPLTAEDWVLRQYIESSETWATVTPLVLPGSDEGKFAKAEKLFMKALGHAGYSAQALADMEFRSVSFWPGAELAMKYQRPDYLRKDYSKEARPWSVYHVRLRWKNPMTGPMAIGAGRHCGLGVFAGLDR
jgi:CRISPR-associated protein Csb2